MKILEKNHEYSNLFQKDEDALIRKINLKRILYEEEINLNCDFYFCDLVVEKIKDLLEEKKPFYLQDHLGQPLYDHEEIKRWIEAPNFNSENLMKKE